MRKFPVQSLVVVVLLLLATGCGGGSSTGPSDSEYPTLGELEAMIKASTAPDSDGDHIPDDVEAGVLGTNPQDRDTDHDGLTDNYEIFGDGLFNRDARVPDRDEDGEIAPLDKDDDGDFVNDGLKYDTDGDGIANFLEYYGYFYDWLTGRFVSCEDVSCEGVTVYRTDPLQRSTDQDPYPDDMEASGLGMDVSVSDPGGHPLVPARPSLTIDLVAYSVTLNENVTYSHGGSLSQGTTWTRETSQSHSHTMEHNWGVGVTAGVGFEGEKPTGSVEVTATYGQTWSNTHETTHSTSRGDSIVNEANWSEARSVNPTEAAHVKLMLKAHNSGSASLSNVLPTLSLRIAGLNVATFEPGNASIELLPPYATYPAEDGVYWVVDRTAAGDPIVLTMQELRAFESGAPISVSVTQMQADVLRMGDMGNWEEVGDANEFLTRCDACSAEIRLDMGDGTTVHHMVYCGQGPSEPRVTLGDALRWTMGAVEDNESLWVSYLDRKQAPQQISVESWRFVLDRDTLALNGIDPDDMAGTMPEDYRMSATLLHPGSVVFAKAPRPANLPKPGIHVASIDYDARRAQVCASDYRGVEDVVIEVLVDPDLSGDIPLQEWVMDEYPAGSNLYTHTFSEAEWAILQGVLDRQMDPTSDSTDELKVRVTSISGEDEVSPFGLIPPDPRAVPPIIDFVRMDVANGSLYVRVRPNDNYPELWTQTYPVAWVKAFHPGFVTSDETIEMGRPSNWYQDSYGWVCSLPTPWNSSLSIKIVAYVAPGVYTERFVRATDVTSAYNQGNADFNAQHYHGVLGLDSLVWTWEWLDIDDLDASTGGSKKLNGFWPDFSGVTYSPSSGMAYADATWDAWWDPGTSTADYYMRYDNESGKEGFKLYFNVPAAKAAPGTDFDALKAALAETWLPAAAPTGGQACNADDIWVLRTSQGRIAKVQVTYRKEWEHSRWWYYFNGAYGDECKLSFRYVVFAGAAADISAESYVIYDKDSDGVLLDGRGSTGYLWDWSATGPVGHTLENDSEMIATLYPAPKAVGHTQTYSVRLEMDGGGSSEKTAVRSVTVAYPRALITHVSDQTFQSGALLRVTLPGGTSIGARTYNWTLTGKPGSSTAAAIENATSSTATLKPDVSGTYIVALTINSGYADEDTITETFDVTIN